MKPTRKLKQLAAKLARACWDATDLDGAELQGWLEEAGVLIGVTVDEPCGPDCRCHACGVSPPWICYRLTEAFR